MNQKAKRLEKFQQQPESTSWRDILSLLPVLGFTLVQGKGSHVVIKKENTLLLVVLIHNGDCKPHYKRELAKILSDFSRLP